MSRKERYVWLGQRGLGVLVLAMFVSCGAMAQTGAQRAESSSPGDATVEASAAVRELRDEVRELRAAVAELRADAERERTERRELRREVEELRGGGGARPGMVEAVVRTVGKDAAAAMNVSPKEDAQDRNAAVAGQEEQKKAGRTAGLDEEYELLAGKVDDQYQTKVESGSKYRMRISGIVLMNLFSNQGVVDNIDLPAISYPTTAGYATGSFGGTLRQSQLGFEVFGPRVGGAKTRADLELDLGGGFEAAPNGVNAGLMRLRTATMRMDWENTSVVAGQDGIFFSPNSPTSFATLAEPALSYAGNLWSWVPQVRVEHRVALGESSNVLIEGGIIDPVSGEVPYSSYYRQPGPGEESRQPGYGTRVVWTHNFFGQPLRVGAGGFYERQNYWFGRNVDAWAAMSDWELPLGGRFAVSGKFYRGKGLGGLYGGLGQSALFGGNPAKPSTEVIGLNTIGGWAQLKYRPAAKWELNWAFGMDNPYASDLEYFQYPQSYGNPALTRNRAGFANVIYRPRSDLLFAAEYRRIETNALTTGASGAGHLNLSVGVLF
jgi:hypothetical protein